MTDGRKEPTSMRIDEAIKRQAERRAKEQHRSLTGYIEWLIMQDVQAAGSVKASPSPATKQRT